MCDNEEEKFEENLPCVQEAIRGLKCKKKIQLCNSWVARLQSSDPDEYELRNQYLYLLWAQLTDGHFDAPFLTCPPCYGKLPPMKPQGTKCCGSARSSSRKSSCCNSSKCQRNGCTRDSCCAKKKSRSVPDIPKNLEIPEIRINATMSNGSASNIPSATETQVSTSCDTSVEMSQETPHTRETQIYQETTNYQEAPNYEEAPNYQETPNYKETRIYQETSREMYEESPCGTSQGTPCEMITESPYAMSEEEPYGMSPEVPSGMPAEASPGMSKEALRRMYLETPVGMQQLTTPCAADYATPAGYEGSTERIQTEGRTAPPQFGSQFRNCQTDMRNFYNLMGGSGNRNALPESLPCSASTPNPMPDARRTLDFSHDKCDSLHNSQYLLISEETPRSETPEQSARNSQNRNSPVNRRCFQPKNIDAAFKRRLAEMNYIYNLRMKTLDEKVKTVDCMNNTLRSQVGQMKVQLAKQNRADEQMMRSLHEENITLKAKIQRSNGNDAGIRNVGQSIEQLEHRLNESINCNNSLRKSLRDLDEKIQLMQQSKAEEVCQLRARQAKDIQCIGDMNNLKLMSLSKDYQRKLQSMEESYKEQLRSYEAGHSCNIQRLISENEATFQEFKDSTNQLITEKEAEIARLQTMMEEQCSKLESDVQGMQSRAGEECNNPKCVACREKVCIMEERLHRADNIKKNCLRYFQGKLFEMLKEKHKHENTVKMLLMKQRAEITLQVFNESQIEIKDAVSRMQERYKRIISCMQNQISSNKVELDDIMGIQLGRVGSARKKCLRNPNPGCDDKTDQT